VERREVAPVQVLEDDRERRLLGRERLERLDDLAQHPLARRAERLALQLLALVGAAERRELHEPRRRVPPQERHDSLAAALAAERSERVEHGEVRFAGTVLLEALPARRPDAARRGRRREERLDEDGLPDPGRAGDEDDLPLPLARAPEPVGERLERALPAD